MTVKRILTVSEELSRKGITMLKVYPLKVSVRDLSDLLSEEGHSMAREIVGVFYQQYYLWDRSLDHKLNGSTRREI